VSEKRETRCTCLRSSFLRASSAAFSSFVIPAVFGTDLGEATGDIARSPTPGDASGVASGLGEGESAPTCKIRAALAARVRAGAATDADAESGGGLRRRSEPRNRDHRWRCGVFKLGPRALIIRGAVPAHPTASRPAECRLCRCSLKFICAREWS